MKRLLTIDPSTSATGWAITEVLSGEKPRFPHQSHIAYPPSGVFDSVGCNWLDRCRKMHGGMVVVVAMWRPDRIICEIPETWKDMTGRGAALSGSTLKLGFVAGCMIGLSADIQTQFVSANEWKGQTPKSLTRERVKEFFGHDEPNEHICDALGIARYFYQTKARGGFGVSKKHAKDDNTNRII